MEHEQQRTEQNCLHFGLLQLAYVCKVRTRGFLVHISEKNTSRLKQQNQTQNLCKTSRVVGRMGQCIIHIYKVLVYRMFRIVFRAEA